MSDLLTPDWDMDDYVVDGTLSRGAYTLELQRTSTAKNGSVLLAGRIVTGPADSNGKSVEDRELELWVPFYSMERFEHKGLRQKKMNVAKKIADLLGTDQEEWPGQRIGLNISVSPNKSGGDPWVNVDDVRPVA